jgi:peptidyl-prolyl cis-trans isomerase B (cyclophilin B)
VIPAGVRTPPPPPPQTETALPRPSGLGPPRRPTAADADTSIDLRLRDAASLDGPAPGAHPRVRIGTTKGAIVVRLYPEWAPLTVANFLHLTDRGFYDGLRWFRIVPNFVVQTGDPKNTGDGDAGYTIPAEENPLEQRSGIISMGLNYTGNKPQRDSAGTQFYLTMSPQFHLNRSFTVFGEIESGFGVLGRLVETDRMTRVERLPPR